VKNWVYEWNMPKNYHINTFDHEGHNHWHTQKYVKTPKLYNGTNFDFSVRSVAALPPLSLTNR